MSLQRIAIVCFEDPRQVTGGVQRRIAAELEYFSARGVEVVVLCEGFEATEVKAGNVTYITVPTPHLLYPLRTLIFSYRASRRLLRLAQIDVVETHHDGGAAALLSTSLRRSGTLFVEVVHGVFSDEYAAVRHYEKLFSKEAIAALGLLPLSIVERAAARRADLVVAVSEYGAGQIESRYGVDRARIFVAPNGIDTALYAPSERTEQKSDEITILYVGRWHARKGVLPLVSAFAIAHAADSRLRLKMIGGGPLEAALRAEVSKFGLSGAVKFLGRLDDEAVRRAYRNADIVCIPSLQEGQGIVALEAQACGAPIVATRAGGLTEAVQEGVTGLVVEPGDVEGLAAALLRMVGDEEMRCEYGRNAVGWARSFQWDRLLDGLNSKYQGLQSNVQQASKVPLHRSEA